MRLTERKEKPNTNYIKNLSFMRKFTFLAVLLLLIGWGSAWAQANVITSVGDKLTDAGNLAEGRYYLIKCVGGRPGWAFAGYEHNKMYLNNSADFDPLTVTSTKYLFRIEKTEGGFYLKTSNGSYISVPNVVPAVEQAMVFSLLAKPNADAGIWNIKTPASYLNVNRSTEETDANWVTTLYNVAGDANGKWEVYPVEVNVENFNITYQIQDADENVLERLTYDVLPGASYPTFSPASQLSFFKNIPTGEIQKTETNLYKITTELPFSSTTITNGSFAATTKWYTLTIRGTKYPTYNDPLERHTSNLSTKEETSASTVFAFLGDAYHGFEICNAAAGPGRRLHVTNHNNELCTYTAEGALFALCKNTENGYQFKLMDGNTTHLNDVNDVLGVWSADESATDDGSTFTFTEVEFDVPDDLPLAKAALTTVINAKPELGTDPGYVSVEEEPKYTTATTVLENTSSTAEQIREQEDIIFASLHEPCIMPQEGKFYMIISAYPAYEERQGVKKAMYVDGYNLKWGNLNTQSRTQIWRLVPTTNGYVMKSYSDHLCPTTEAASNNDSKPYSLTSRQTVINLNKLNAPGQFNVKYGNYFTHTDGHNTGAGVSGNIVNWNGAVGTASAWYIHEVDEEVLAALANDVTINYTVENVVKKAVTDAFDLENLEIPAIDFVTLGNPEIDSENKIVTVPCTYNLPFTASTNFTNAAWYAVDMHSNQGAYTWTYDAEEEKNVQLPITSSASLNSGYMPANCRWAFVGNPFDGFKIYNKAAGETMTLRKEQAGNNPAVMSATDNRNLFFLYATNGNIANSFALKLEGDTYYLNHQTTLMGYASNDEGSSCRAFALTTDIPMSSFYRIKGVANELYLTTGSSGSRMPMIEDGTTAASIFYYGADRKLLNYGNGLYAYKTSETGAIGSANTWEVKENTADHFIFYASAVEKNGRYLYNHNSGGETLANRNSSLAGNNTLWTVERVTELPITVSAAKWATFCAPVALSIPVDGNVEIEVYYAKSVEAEVLAMEKLTGGVIPAGLPVLIYADVEEATTFPFTIVDNVSLPDGVNTQLKGTTAKINIENGTSYVLAMLEGRVAFGVNNTGVVPGFKAYLQPENATTASAFSIRFDEFVTGIEGVSIAESDKNVEYYDLSGRRVYFPVRGIYVTNRGEKVFIK